MIENATKKLDKVKIVMGESFTKKKVAVFVDNENLFYGCGHNANAFPDYKKIMEFARGCGRVVHAICLSDWTRLQNSVKFVVGAGFEPRFSCNAITLGDSDVKRQSSADASLHVEIFETLHFHPDVDVVILVSGDRDFISLVHAMKRMGKYVIVMSEDRSMAWDLSEAADQSVTLQEINALMPKDKTEVRSDYPVRPMRPKPVFIPENADDKTIEKTFGKENEK